MADVTITPTTVSWDTAFAQTAGTGQAIDPADTYYIAYPKSGKLVIAIESTYASGNQATFAVGVGVASGVGTLVESIANNVIKAFVLSRDRFVNNDGNVQLDFAASNTGFIRSHYIPD